MSNSTKYFIGAVLVAFLALIWWRNGVVERHDRYHRLETERREEQRRLADLLEVRMHTLATGSAEERVAAAETLVAESITDNEHFAPWSIEHLEDSDARVRFWACRSLAQLERVPQSGIASLERALSDPEEYVRMAAAHALEHADPAD